MYNPAVCLDKPSALDHLGSTRYGRMLLTRSFSKPRSTPVSRAADCIGAHANGPDGVGDIDAVAMRYVTLAGTVLPICVTEFGYGLPVAGQAPPGFEWIMSHTEGAQVETIGTGMAWAVRSGFVRMVILWNLNYDGNGDPLDPNAPYGLMRDGWRSGALAEIPE